MTCPMTCVSDPGRALVQQVVILDHRPQLLGYEPVYGRVPMGVSGDQHRVGVVARRVSDVEGQDSSLADTRVELVA